MRKLPEDSQENVRKLSGSSQEPLRNPKAQETFKTLLGDSQEVLRGSSEAMASMCKKTFYFNREKQKRLVLGWAPGLGTLGRSFYSWALVYLLGGFFIMSLISGTCISVGAFHL